jgi:Amt family ammonium transporter
MKIYAAATIMLLGTMLPLTAQEESATSSPALESFIARTDKSQAAVLKNTEDILVRLAGLEKIVARAQSPMDGSSAGLSAFEARLQALESKLAEAPVSSGQAAPSEALESLQANINFVWIVTAAALVFFMQAGFCMVELGFTRAKNAINICMKNFLDFSVGSLVFLFVGFALMFGSSVSGWFGSGPFWLSSTPGDSPLWVFWFFQLVFAGTAATILSGAMAERTKFVGYLVFTIIMTGLIYPILGHWAWGSFAGGFGYGGQPGWLEAMGFADFAGSTVVHGIGGAAALAGILVIGPRVGRFRADGSPNLITGHNMPLATLGTFILWFGWYGFNAGSTLLGDAGIGRVAVNTTLSPAAGALAAMFTMWILQGRPDLGMTLNGGLGGLVGITANCNLVEPASAVVIGLVSGLIATFGAVLLERLKVDDAVGAVPVHLFCGWWGTLCVALFNEAGFSPKQLGVQALGTVAITVSCFIVAYISFQIIDKVMGLRASEDEQDLGLDFTEHSGAAYPDFITGEQGT